MLMAVNVVNSTISVGFFEEGCVLASSFEISADTKKTSDEYIHIIRNIASDNKINLDNVNGAIISSVVPQITQRIRNAVEILSKTEPLIVGPGVKTGFHIRIDNPSELGGDIVSNSAYAVRMCSDKKYIFIADIGSVNTISVVNNREYCGCVIFPGIEMSFDSLHINTALLPNVNLSNSSNVIGKNSKESICSGVVLGNAMVLDGFVERFLKEMKCKKEDVFLLATGEYAKYVLDNCKYSFTFEEHLTLKGLSCIYSNTTNTTNI